MTDTIVIALIAAGASLIGSGVGALAAGRLITYRVEQLEKKVGAFNNFSQRVLTLENTVDTCQQACGHKRYEHLLQCHPGQVAVGVVAVGSPPP